MANFSRSIPSCTAQRHDGSFCDAKSIPDAPFPICLKHAAKIMHFLNSYVPNDFVSRMGIGTRLLEQQRERDAENRARRSTVQEEVVYYIHVGEHVKIGYTTNLKARIASYPPSSKVLAIEYGSRSLEQQRHAQFAEDLDARNEWFRPSPKLMAHIAEVRAAQQAAA